MWDPSFLPSDAQTVGDLHEEIEKLASLFEYQPPRNLAAAESSQFGTNLEPPCYSTPHVRCAFPSGSSSGVPPHVLPSAPEPISKESSILSNWKPQSLRETELLLIIDDIQNKLKQERACNGQLRQTIMEQRQALDICHASEKFYKLKAMKLEAQSARSRNPSIGKSSSKVLDARPGRPRNVRPMLTTDDSNVPFSRITQRRDSRSASNNGHRWMSSIPTKESSNTDLPIFTQPLFPGPVGAKSSSHQGMSHYLPDPDFMLSGVWNQGAVSDSELPCRNSSNDTGAGSVMLLSSSSARRRSSSANRVREVMQSIGFLSARGPAPSNKHLTEALPMEQPSSTTAASSSSTPSHRSRLLPSNSTLPSRPVSLARPSNLGSSLPSPSEASSHQNVARAIANERSRQQLGRSTDWTPPSTSRLRLSPAKQQDPPTIIHSSPQPEQDARSSGPLDIDQRLCSLRQLILQATANATSSSTAASSSYPQSSFPTGNF